MLQWLVVSSQLGGICTFEAEGGGGGVCVGWGVGEGGGGYQR